ncbi:MAG: hypothetical protein KIT61_18030 [Pyrinomonadaceae bacterium]|nr:hypothetical protein [Blastocatellia bacterium]MCW5958483.1 hypothetical protein [Pyrinomonadaceae bacterium]
MAHRESIQSDIFKLLLHGEPFFWAVSSSVGYGCRNKREDVLLIQFFLNRIIEEARNIITSDIIMGVVKDPAPFKKIPEMLVPDGDFGGKTWAAVKWLQKVSGYCVVDGMVSESDGTNALTPKSKMWYTIHILNYFYRDLCTEYFSDIRSDPKLPSLLCSHLTGLPDLV